MKAPKITRGIRIDQGVSDIVDMLADTYGIGPSDAIRTFLPTTEFGDLLFLLKNQNQGVGLEAVAQNCFYAFAESKWNEITDNICNNPKEPIDEIRPNLRTVIGEDTDMLKISCRKLSKLLKTINGDEGYEFSFGEKDGKKIYTLMGPENKER
jgi:hypothetical protein